MLLEVAMGATIPGNVICLALAMVLLLVAALVIGYIVARVAGDSVPVGYGP